MQSFYESKYGRKDQESIQSSTTMKSIFVTNIEREKNPQPMRYVGILTRVDMHLGQSGDVYL